MYQATTHDLSRGSLALIRDMREIEIFLKVVMGLRDMCMEMGGNSRFGP